MEFAKFYTMICTIALEMSIYIKYDLHLKWSKAVNKYTQYDTLSNTGLWKSMVFEMIICALCPYPFLDGLLYREYVEAYDVHIYYEVNDLMLFIMFSRTYLPCRFSFYLTDFMNPRTQRVC